MNELVVIVEGETEQTFVRDQLAADLALHGTIAWPVLPGRRRNQGGIKRWEIAVRDIIYTLREGRYCSTMFDYYGMPEDWPGRSDAAVEEWSERATHVETAIHAAVVAQMGTGFNPKYFVPYVQLHEFEALAFADVSVLASVVSPVGTSSMDSLIQKFSAILDLAKHPEAIDDGRETCPSRRISALVPAYRKPLQGPIITSRIGLDLLRQRCTHFGRWLAALESLGAANT